MSIPRLTDAEFFIAKAEQCFRLARSVRGDHAGSRVAAELESIGHEFMARAVEIDTERDRAETRRQRCQ
jgi:hypothetical protein